MGSDLACSNDNQPASTPYLPKPITGKSMFDIAVHHLKDLDPSQINL
jgi:hypothetical protein